LTSTVLIAVAAADLEVVNTLHYRRIAPTQGNLEDMQGRRGALSDGVTGRHGGVPNGTIDYLLQGNDCYWHVWCRLVRDLVLVEEERAVNEHSIPLEHLLLVREVFQQLPFIRSKLTFVAVSDVKHCSAAIRLSIIFTN